MGNAIGGRLLVHSCVVDFGYSLHINLESLGAVMFGYELNCCLQSRVGIGVHFSKTCNTKVIYFAVEFWNLV